MNLPSAIGLLVATAFSVLPSGCKRHKLEYPDLVERSAVYTIEDGRVVRIPAYRGEQPVLGQCIEPRTYSLATGPCVAPSSSAPVGQSLDSPKIAARMLDRQGFRSSSRMLSVESSVEVDASGQKAASTVTVAKHRLLLEWNRYAVYSLDPFKTKLPAGEPQPYVSAVEYGVGVRIILEVSLTNVDATTNLSFGFGTVAAAVATGNAQVAVQYDTIGVSRDILPADLPVSIESVGDISRMMMGLYGAVQRISAEWNKRVDASKSSDSKISLTEAPLPLVVSSTTPEGAGDSIDGLTVLGTGDEIPAERVATLVEEVSQARTFIEGSKELKKGPLFDSDSKEPVVGGAGFDELEQKVDAGKELSAAEVGTLLESIEKHGEGLEALTVEERTPLAGLPESLRKPTSVELTLSSYYPILRGDEDGLFPRGFSAAPIAYYVTRTPENIRRDYCEDLRLSHATKKQLPDARAQAECGTYWLEETAQSVEETFCRTRLIRSATRLTGPGPLLRRKCKAYIEAEKAAVKEKATAQQATPKPAAPPAAPMKPPK